MFLNWDISLIFMAYTNLTFAHGNGPYSRSLDLAVAVNKKLIKENTEPLRIIIPLVYGERQIEIMLEEHGQTIEENPDLFLLDETQGMFLRELLFQGKDYNENLRTLLERQGALENRIRNHLSGKFEVERFDGSRVDVNGQEINVEMSHNPRVSAGVQNSFYTTIAYFSEILERTGEATLEGKLEGFDVGLLRDVRQRVAEKVEKSWKYKFMPEPNTFSYDGTRESREEIWTPPFIHRPKQNPQQVKDGMYVMVTGIAGLEGLFEQVRSFGMKIYCPPFVKTEGVFEGADNTHLPDFVANPNIKYQFARSGWSSVWLSLMTQTPFITPSYVDGDDPEIFFNEITLEHFRLGVVFSADKFPHEVLEEADEMSLLLDPVDRLLDHNYCENELLEGILDESTYDGMDYTARIIADVLCGKDIDNFRNKKPVLQGRWS